MPARPEVTGRRTDPVPDPTKLSAVELNTIVSLERAAEISSLSEDSLRRHFGDRIIKLSPRRLGMRLRHALLLNDQTTDDTIVA